MVLKYAAAVSLAAMLALAAVLAGPAVGARKAEARKIPAAGTVNVTGCTGTSVALDAAEKKMLDLHNRERASMGLSKLCVHPALQRAAEAHSREMIDRDYFSHDSANGESFSARLTRYGYKWRTAGENIAWGTGSPGSPDAIFESWMDSPGHKANILNKNYREIGIGAAKGAYETYDNASMWTADFGTR